MGGPGSFVRFFCRLLRPLPPGPWLGLAARAARLSGAPAAAAAKIVTKEFRLDSGWIRPQIQPGFNLDSTLDSSWIRARIQLGFDLRFNVDSTSD